MGAEELTQGETIDADAVLALDKLDQEMERRAREMRQAELRRRDRIIEQKLKAAEYSELARREWEESADGYENPYPTPPPRQPRPRR